MIKKALLILLVTLNVFSLCSCSNNSDEDKPLRIGMVVGGIFDQYVPDVYPGAQVEYFYAASDLPLALESGKIDLYLDDELSAKEHCKAHPGQKIDRVVHDDYYGFIFNKDKEYLRDQMNDFLAKISEDGSLSMLQQIWLVSGDDSLKVINYDELTGENGIIKVGTAATMPPLDYVKDGEYVGYELAVIERFCKDYGYGMEIENADFSSTMASVTSGTCDIGAASYSITEERKKSMLFSNPHISANCVAVVRYDENEEPLDENAIKGERIGVVTGALFDIAVKNNDPDAQIEYYNITSDLPAALDGGKLDGYTVDEPVAKMLCNIYQGHYIAKKLTNEEYGIVIDRNKPEIQEQFNEYIKKITDNGELFTLQDIWLGKDESKKVIDFESIANNEKILKLATTSSMQPFDYIKDGNYAGYEIALVASFCKEYGYGLEIEDSNFASVIAAVSSGKADLGCCVITITDERKQTMNFTDTIYQGGIVLVKKKIIDDEAVSFDSLKGADIGIQIGSSYDVYIAEGIEDVNIEYFNFISDMSAALDSGKISGFVLDEPIAQRFVKENGNKYKILDSLHDIEYGIVMPKNKADNEQLYKQLYNYISKLKQNGSLEEIYDLWINDDDSVKAIDIESLSNINGEIILGVASSTGAPFIYIENGKILGFEIDIIFRFCKDYGYKLVIDDYSLDGLFPAISTGKCDIGVGGISITEERKETMLFVDEQLTSGCVVIVKNEDAIESNTNINNRIIDSFYKTFIKEDRYKLFISGLLTTILVTILAIVIGTVLGFVMYMLYRDLGPFGKKIVDTIVNIIQKTPVVVILMIFYYIVFGKVDISGSIVSIVGLSILFASSVKGLIAMGVKSIDIGISEAAYTLGYTKNQAFIRIILPQAVLNVISGYKSAIITLIKDSAIIGYIAVQDLTKVSDIVRSRTYEAFFPLIVTAIIYYAIATLFIYIVSKFEIRIDPKQRKEIRILKEVKTNDND